MRALTLCLTLVCGVAFADDPAPEPLPGDAPFAVKVSEGQILTPDGPMAVADGVYLNGPMAMALAKEFKGMQAELAAREAQVEELTANQGLPILGAVLIGLAALGLGFGGGYLLSKLPDAK
jgi:hypothetical protein